jgi:hypothetical protein
MTYHARGVRHVPLVVALGGAATGCLDLAGACANQYLNELAAPGGQHRAVVFERDCGATTGFTTQVSVLRVGAALPDSGGNVFRAEFRPDSTRAPVTVGPGGGPRVSVRWLAADTLEVRYDARATVFGKDATVAGLAIRFLADSAP